MTLTNKMAMFVGCVLLAPTVLAATEADLERIFLAH